MPEPTLNATAQAAPPGPEVRWSGRSRGGYFGNWFFVQLIRWCGLWPAYFWLIFVAAYFTLASPQSYRSSVQFLRRVRGPQPFWRWPFLVYQHFFSFGVTLLDRLGVIMGQARMEYSFENEALFREYLGRGQGIILLGAHLGSWDLGGHLLGRLDKPVNLIVLEKEEAQIRKLYSQALAAKQFQLLSTDGHPLRSIPIIAALRRGEIVALHGDRTFGGAAQAAPFLGGTAQFPVGAFLLAAASGAPIFQVFSVREKIGHYRCYTFPPQFLDRKLLRATPEQLQPYVNEYADRLAEFARRYPYQWSNFYPFWEETV
ncbi:MAG: hypothetical protein WCO56_28905 [Verrucomicrobiota bacterium]